MTTAHDVRPTPPRPAPAPRDGVPIGALTRLTMWSATLVAAHVGLSAAATALPSPPDPRHLDELWRVLSTTDPAVTAFSLLRLVALAVTWYLGLVTALSVAGRVLRLRPLQSLADAIAVPAARALLGRMLGAGLVLAVAGAPLGTFAGAAPSTPGAPERSRPPSRATMEVVADPPPTEPARPPATVRMHLVPDDAPASDERASAPPTEVPITDPATVPTTALAPTTAPATTTTERPTTERPTTASPTTEAPTPSLPTTTTTTTPSVAVAPNHPSATGSAEDPSSTTPPAAIPDAVPASSTWTIVPGDHLWHVATVTLTGARGRPPTNAEIAGYLDTLITANRDRLVVHDNPDLVFPGQVFVLPPVPAA